MKEKDFIKVYKEERNLKNLKEAQHRISTFWETVEEILQEDKKLVFKGWGIFEIKPVRAREYCDPRIKKLRRLYLKINWFSDREKYLKKISMLTRGVL